MNGCVAVSVCGMMVACSRSQCSPPPRYASLYFCVGMEAEDNELLSLEVLHRYVELLDKYFGNVRAC